MIGTPETVKQGRAARRYKALESKRSGFVRRGHRCSQFSVPALFPEQKNDVSLDTPHQSLIARGVNNLASKLMMTLLPPNMAFFKLDIDESRLTEEEKAEEGFREEIDKGLGKVERAFLRETAAWSDRVGLFEALEHLLVVGNVMVYLRPGGGIKCHYLDSYVLERDGNEQPCEMVIKETVNEYDIPELTLQKLSVPKEAENKTYDMYTYLERDRKRWTIFQEIDDIEVHGSRGTYPLDACPWIPLRLFKASDSAYGRGYVEKFFGDIKSLDGLSQAILEGSTAAAKVIWMLAPNSTTSEDDLADAPNMGFVVGKREDVQALQLEKHADFRVAQEYANTLKQDLERAFILHSAVQRRGERVTAEEIKKMIEDLETTLGGVYSLLALEFQLPYARCRLKQLQKKKRIPELPPGIVKPIIITGVTALGRNSDKEKMLELLKIVQEAIGPEGVKYFDIKALIVRICTSVGVDIDGILTSDGQDEAAKQEQQSQHSFDTLAPGGMQMVGDMMKADPSIMEALGQVGQMGQMGQMAPPQ